MLLPVSQTRKLRLKIEARKRHFGHLKLNLLAPVPGQSSYILYCLEHPQHLKYQAERGALSLNCSGPGGPVQGSACAVSD